MKTKAKGKLTEVLAQHTHENGLIDVFGVAKQLGFCVIKSNPKDSSDVAYLTPNFRDKKLIVINPSCSDGEARVALAWVLSEYLLNQKISSKSYSMSVFQLRNLRAVRHSRVMLLATRLTMTEDVISRLGDICHQHLEREISPHLTSEFCGSVVKDSSVSFVLSMLEAV